MAFLLPMFDFMGRLPYLFPHQQLGWSQLIACKSMSKDIMIRVDGWNPVNSTADVVGCPIISRVLKISQEAFFRQQYHEQSYVWSLFEWRRTSLPRQTWDAPPKFPFELGPKGHAIAYVVWLPYAHAYASLTPLHSWLTGGLFWHGLTRSLRRHICYVNICPHRKCLREPFFPLARNHTRPSWTFELCFCSNHIIFRGGSFETNVLVHCSPPSVSSDTKACLGGIVGWAYAGLTLTLRGPYADFTSTCWKFLHEI